MGMNVELQLHGAPDYEMRVCVECGHTNVRVHNPERKGELECACCGRSDFAIYKPFWIPDPGPRYALTDEGERYRLEATG